MPGWVGPGETKGTGTFHTESAGTKGETLSCYDTMSSLRGRIIFHYTPQGQVAEQKGQERSSFLHLQGLQSL